MNYQQTLTLALSQGTRGSEFRLPSPLGERAGLRRERSAERDEGKSLPDSAVPDLFWRKSLTIGSIRQKAEELL
jgi:hypothetical protein